MESGTKIDPDTFDPAKGGFVGHLFDSDPSSNDDENLADIFRWYPNFEECLRRPEGGVTFCSDPYDMALIPASEWREYWGWKGSDQNGLGRDCDPKF